MRKLTFLVVAFIIVACSPPTIKPLSTATHTETVAEIVANATKPVPTLTPTPETITAVGNWNLREADDGSGGSVGVVWDDTHLVVIKSTENWMLVQTVGLDVEQLTGWIRKDCCK